MFTALAAIFSSARIYIILGVVMLAMAVGAYIFYLRSEVSTAQAQLAVAQATINEAKSVIDQDTETIAQLQSLDALTQKTLADEQHKALTIQQELSTAKEAVNAIPEPKTCQALDPRDRAAINGVRSLIGSPTAPHSDKGGKGVPTGKSP